MRLAVVCHPTYGGSGVVATELAIELADRGHHVHVVSYETPIRLDRWRPNLTFHAVEIGSYPLFRYQPYMLNLTNTLIELVKEHGVELIHSHYAIPHAQAAWAAREVLREQGRRIALACTLHGTDITLVGREPAFHELTRFTIAKQDLLTAPSAWLANEMQKYFGVCACRAQVIPNFVDLTRFRPVAAPNAVRSSLAAPEQKLLVHASNMRPVKRVEDVVRAFAVVRTQLPAVLALAGEGPELVKAENLARQMGVREHLRLLGNHERIEAVLQAADLFLLPSDAESFGLAALEAMACGCPVLGYRAGGLPEVVEDGVSGVLCPTGEGICLGSVALNLLRDAPRYAAMRAAARRAAERFAPPPIVDRYEKALLGLVEPPAAART